MTTWSVAACAGLAVLLWVGPRPDPRRRLEAAEPPRPRPPRGDPGWLHRRRWLWSLLAGAAGWVFVGGQVGPVAGLTAGLVTWWGIARAEPAPVRREREQLARDLPHLVALLAAALSAGAAPADAVDAVSRALAGPGAVRLGRVSARLALGADPAQVWSDLGRDPELGPLGRTMARAHTTGGSVVTPVQQLADELADRARAEVEDRARSVGVKAALPLGLCLLPAFVLIGIVPLVVGLLSRITWQ